jgi:RNA polymerase sigma-70 factor, ECF subfamily
VPVAAPSLEIRYLTIIVDSMPELDPQSAVPGPGARAAPPSRAGENAMVDMALVQRMAAGDELALGQLYDRWSDAVHALVVRIVRDDADTEEVVEAVFWQAWQQAARYTSDRGAPGAWLLAMARSRSLDRLRTLRRRHEEQPADDSVVSNAPAVGDPLSELNANERAIRVTAAVQQLPPDQRTVMELAYFEGFSQTEIADKLSVPLGTVKTRARLGLKKLRDALAELREVAS